MSIRLVSILNTFLWGFNAVTPKSIPSKVLLQATSKFVGPHHLSINKDSLIKDNPNTMIDCDGIAQGYTVDQLTFFLQKNQLKRAYPIVLYY